MRLQLPPHDPKHWYQSALPVEKVMVAPSEHGFATASEVVAHIAKERGLKPRALMKQVDGVRFLRATYPQLVDQASEVRGGYSQVEYLAKVHRLDRERADRLAPAVLAGRISMALMKQEYEQALASRGSKPSGGAMARRRALNFADACGPAIARNPEFFGASPRVSIERDFRIDGLTLDYALLEGDELRAAVLCRVGGIAVATREAVALAALLALVTRKAHLVWLLVPISATDFASEVAAAAKDWAVDRVGTAALAEVGAPTVLLIHAPAGVTRDAYEVSGIKRNALEHQPPSAA